MNQKSVSLGLARIAMKHDVVWAQKNGYMD